MRSRLILGAVALVAVAAFGAGAAGAVPAKSAAQAKTVTFHLVEVDHGFNYIDNPPRQGKDAPPLIGDEIVFSNELQTSSGAHAGWLMATCMIAIGGTRGGGPCYGVFALKGGELMAMAASKTYGNAPTDIAIVGGTGVYAGATGTVHSVTKTESTSADTVTLTWR
jgi:hypothetical protein